MVFMVWAKGFRIIMGSDAQGTRVKRADGRLTSAGNGYWWDADINGGYIMAYYQLFVREEGEWTISFGDRDKECVEFEAEDYRDPGVRVKDIKLVTFARVPTQGQLHMKLESLNA